jgi:hypothetical protein
MNRMDVQNGRKAANSSIALGRYKQASLLPLVKLLLTIARPKLVLTNILMRNLQASQLRLGTRNPAKKGT